MWFKTFFPKYFISFQCSEKDGNHREGGALLTEERRAREESVGVLGCWGGGWLPHAHMQDTSTGARQTTEDGVGVVRHGSRPAMIASSRKDWRECCAGRKYKQV